MERLNPLKLLRHSLSDSRLLRLLFVLACLGWLLLLGALLRRPAHLRLAGLLYFFHLFGWYFALALRSGLREHQQRCPTPGSRRAAAWAEEACSAALLFCQILFLLAVFRLLES